MNIAAIAAIALLSCSQTAPAQATPGQATVENAGLRATFSAAAPGPMTALVDKQTGRDLLTPADRALLFQLEFTESPAPDAKRFSVTNRDAGAVQVDGNAGAAESTARVTFQNCGGREIRVECKFCAVANDPFLRCRIAATFPEPLVLEKIQFPMLTLRAADANAAADAVVLGATKGGMHRRPSAMKEGSAITAAQPGTLAVQFGCWYDPQVGLLTAALDPRGYHKTIEFRREAAGLLASWTVLGFEQRGYQQDFDMALAVFHGADAATPPDWRDAADLYKAWAERQSWCAKKFAERTDVPAWMKEGPAMVRFSRNWLAQPDTIRGWFDHYWKRCYPERPPLVVAYWGWEKVGSWVTPDYFPLFPSDEQFRALADYGRALGGHAFPWPSGYRYTLMYDKQPDGSFRWDNRKNFAATARPHAVSNRDGALYVMRPRWILGGQNTCMCPGDPWTVAWFNNIAVELAKRGAEMIQVDQIVGGSFPPCYCREHGHPPGPGPWTTDVFRRQLESMLAACRKVQPDAVVCFEEPNEHFIQQVGIQDYRDWEALRRANVDPASVFNYVYHEYLPVFQSNPRPGDRVQAAWCLADGQIPHLIPSKTVLPGPLLGNGDFELSAGELPQDWPRVGGFKNHKYLGTAARDESEHHDGRASLRLTNAAADDIAQAAQNVFLGATLTPGKTYELSAWIKTRDVRQANSIGVAALVQSLKNLGSWQIPLPQGTRDWTQARVRFTVPAGAEFLRIMLNLHGPGTVWIDGVRLAAVRDDGALVDVPRPTTPADHEFMRAWVTLYHGAGRPYLALGRILHPPRLECKMQDISGRRLPVMWHNAFAAADGSEAVVVVNATAQPQHGRLTWRGQPRDIQLAPWEARLLLPTDR